MRNFSQPRPVHSFPLVGIVALVVILGGFIVAGPLLMRSVEDTRQSVTELWLAYLRVRSAAGVDGSSAGSVNGPSPNGLLRDLERAHAQIEGNRFFEIIGDQNPKVAVWLDKIERGGSAHQTQNPTDVLATNRAFENLSRFMRDHSQQQYRALQTGIWSSLLLLLGMAGVLARLYSQNRRLASSLNIALDAKSQLIRETHHRVKNNLALVASLVSIKESSLGGEVDLSDLQRRISAVEHVHDMLSRSDAGLTIPMREYLENLMASVMSSVSIPGIEYRVYADPIELPAKKATALGIIVNETVTNAVKHAFDCGGPNMVEMNLETPAESGLAVLTVSNSGRSFPDNFDPSDCSSLGMQLVSGLVEQLSGTFEIRSEPETAIVVTFPLEAAVSRRLN